MTDRLMRPMPGGPSPRTALFALACAAVFPVGGAAQAPPTDIFLADLALDGPRVEVRGRVNVTNREGYDNQPAFTGDGTALLYTSQREGQTDIYRYDLATGAISRVTDTPESEYSPTPLPSGGRFSSIRVEADSTQRLWSFALDGSDPRLVFPEIAPVGYHAWIDPSLAALFVLGSPPSLVLARPGPGAGEVAATAIGRSLHAVPGRQAVSFLHRTEDGPWISSLDPATRRVTRLARPLEDAEDFAWTPGGILLMGREARLYAFDPAVDQDWRLVADLAGEGIASITRLAVSPDGRRLALVAARP